MTGHMRSEIRFARLSDIPGTTITAHMQDPRVTAHLPLLDGPWTAGKTAQFVTQKEAAWARDGLGHWAILADDTYIGWGGFELENGAWDFGLVLTAEAFGLGLRVTRHALAFAKHDPRIPFVTFLLPDSRRHLGALSRLGAEHEGGVLLGHAHFQRFRLSTT